MPIRRYIKQDGVSFDFVDKRILVGDLVAISEPAPTVFVDIDVAATSNTILDDLMLTLGFTFSEAAPVTTIEEAAAEELDALTAIISSWQQPVLDKDLTGPPAAVEGDRYLVASAGATGDWATHENEFATYNGATWDFVVPVEGFASWVEDENTVYIFDGAAWAPLAGGGGSDTDAIHDNVAGEISALTLVTADGADHLLIEDDSDSDNKKRILVSDLLGGGTDAAAIHNNVAAEISAIAAKTTLVAADIFIIEDSEAANVKKSTTLGDIDHDLLTNFVTNEHLDWTADLGATNINVANITAGAVTQHVGSVDHDLLLNFLAAEHVDWAGAGAGTIHTDNYIEGGPGTDTDAIHDNVAGEIAALGLVTAAGTDHILIEDASDSNNKKRIAVSDLLDGGGETNTASNQGAGAGVFRQKTGLDLEFRSLESVGDASNMLTIAATVGPDDEVEFTLNDVFTNLNTALGTGAGNIGTVIGFSNVSVGGSAAPAVLNGGGNVVVGNTAGLSLTNGSNNLFLGASAAASAATGDNNIILNAGQGADVPAAGTSMHLNIGDALFGFLNGSQTIRIGGSGVVTQTEKLAVVSGGADTSEVTSVETTGTNGAKSRDFVGDRTPVGNVTGDPGDVYRRVGGTSSEIFVHTGASADNTSWTSLVGFSGNKFIFITPFSNAGTAKGTYNTVAIGSNASVEFSFRFPPDMTTLVGVSAVGIPNAGVTAQSFTFSSNYAADTEAFQTHTGTVTENRTAAANTIDLIDTGAIWASAAANDYAGLEVDHNAIGTTIGYIGVLVEYT